MFDAQLLQCQSDGSDVDVFSPWLPRGGDYALFTLEVVQSTLAASFSSISVHIYHKNTEDTGDGSLVSATAISRSSNGISTAMYGALKQLVRYKFTVGAPGSSDKRWALFRMLSPVWFDAVKG